MMRDDKRWTVLLMLANLAGIGFGYYYYWKIGQFDPSHQFYQPPWLWPFVADSPNAVVLMSVALIGWHYGLKSRVLDGLAFVQMVYVGVWTTYLFVLYPDQLGTFDWAGVADGNANPVLFVSHMGMPLEAMLLVPHLLERREAPWLLAAMPAWAALNMYLDYGSPDLRPAPHVDAGTVLAVGSIVIMVGTLAAWAWFAMRARRPTPH